MSRNSLSTDRSVCKRCKGRKLVPAEEGGAVMSCPDCEGTGENFDLCEYCGLDCGDSCAEIGL